jgi:DNA-directed RNA polymerase sigma subunit (sigma70/sigma32)
MNASAAMFQPCDGFVDDDVDGPWSTRTLRADQEYALARQLRQHGDVDAERRLIGDHLRLVTKIAWGYREYDVAFSTLIYEGNRALMAAVRHYDPDRGYRLATYLKPRIHLAIVSFLVESWSDAGLTESAETTDKFLGLCKLEEQLTSVVAKFSRGWPLAALDARWAEPMIVPAG